MNQPHAASHPASPTISSQPGFSGLKCLALVARFLGCAADAEQIHHQRGLSGTPVTADDLVRAARGLALKSKTARLETTLEGIRLLGKGSLPCILETHHHDDAAAEFLVLARVEGDKALIHDPQQERPVLLSLDELAARLSGRAVLITSRAQLAGALARFDFTWFVPAVVKYRRLLAEALVASFALQIFALVTPLFFQVVMDKVLVHQGLATLQVIGVGLLATVLFESVLSALRTYVFAHTTSRIDVELGARLFRHLLGLPLAYFEARRIGDSVARVRELENIRNFLTGPALTSVMDLLFTFVFLAVMLWYSVPLTLLVLASLPLYALLMGSTMPAFRRRLDEKFARGAENQAFLVEAVSGIQTLKAGATEPQAIRRWDEQLAAYVASSFRVTKLAAFAGEGIQLIQKLVTVGILWLGAYQVMDGAMTVGSLIAFNMLAGRVAQPVLRLAQLWQELQQAGIAVARLGDILNTPTETRAASRTQLPALRGDIEFDQVRFRYRPDGSEVLRGISFHLRAGEVLGIVGRSGSGKSTVAKLVQRLYVPERGRVKVDGVDLALADPAWLRRQIGVVLQENRLFARSVRDNIALADPGRTGDRPRFQRLSNKGNFKSWSVPYFFPATDLLDLRRQPNSPTEQNQQIRNSAERDHLRRRQTQTRGSRMKLLHLTTLFLPILSACTSGPIAKAILDQQVDRLCAVDGGIRVYRKIKLPPKMFNQWGQVHVPAERFVTKDSDYFYTSEYYHPEKSNKKITKIHFKMFKKSEKALLGESISYLRTGGDFIGPWQESSYICPMKSGNVDLAGEIFELDTEEKNNGEH